MRRRFFRGRRRRVPTQWIAPQNVFNTNTDVVWINNGNPQQVGLEIVGATSQAAAFDPVQVGSMKIERIIGEVPHPRRIFDATLGSIIYGTFGAGIVIVTKDSTGGGWRLPSPCTYQDGSAPWLWLHHWPVEVLTAPSLNFMHQGSMNMHVDIRVKRRLRPMQALALIYDFSYIAGGAVGNTFTVTWSPFIRCLISRIA